MEIRPGYTLEEVDAIPPEALFRRHPSKWFWLRERITELQDDGVLLLTCPSKRDAELAYASIRNEHTYRRIPGYKLVSVRVPEDDSVEDGRWRVYVQKTRKE